MRFKTRSLAFAERLHYVLSVEILFTVEVLHNFIRKIAPLKTRINEWPLWSLSVTNDGAILVTVTISCTVSGILSVICQNLKRSRDLGYILPFGVIHHDSGSTRQNKSAHEIW